MLAATSSGAEVVGSGAAAMMHCSLAQSMSPNFVASLIVTGVMAPLASALRNVAPPLRLQSDGPL